MCQAEVEVLYLKRGSTDSQVYFGIKFVSKLGILFFLVVIYTMLSYYMGLFTAPHDDSPPSLTGLSWRTFKGNWNPDYQDGVSFSVAVSIFFPCFTGILRLVFSFVCTVGVDVVQWCLTSGLPFALGQRCRPSQELEEARKVYPCRNTWSCSHQPSDVPVLYVSLGRGWNTPIPLGACQ